MHSVISHAKPIPFTDAQTLILRIKNQVCAGFPSPAEDLGAERIDLSKVLIKHPQATYLLKACGHSMVEAGIFDNDIGAVAGGARPRER